MIQPLFAREMTTLLSFLRIRQWVKNIFVLAPLLFSQKWMNDISGGGGLILSAMAGFFAFCLTSSAVYVFNDIIDVQKDKCHPIKKLRPLPSGKISVPMAWVIETVLCAGAAGAVVFLHQSMAGLLLVGYFVLMIFYSLLLKHIPLIDVATISGGFLIRVWFGAMIIHVPASGFILLITLTLSLFLGFSKRKAELVRMDTKATHTRPVLAFYTPRHVTFLLYLTAAATIVGYAFYTVASVARFHSPWLILSTAFVAFGFGRYLALLNSPKFREDPTETLLRDKSLFLCCALYVIYVAVVLCV